MLSLFIFRIFPIEKSDNKLNPHTTLGLKPNIFLGEQILHTATLVVGGLVWRFAFIIYFNDMTIFDFIHRST